MIGDKIREVRKNKGLTLNNIAESTGFTASYISQIERNVIDPSISSLRKISLVLEVPLYTFLDEESKQTLVTRADKRKKLLLPESSIVYEFLTPITTTNTPFPKMEIIYFQLNATSWSREDYSYHKAEECIIVIQGTILVDLLEETYELKEGDSIYIRENVPHKVYNPGSTKAIAFMCITPPAY